MFATFASDATVAVLADWIELDHHLSERLKTTDSRVVRADRVISDDLEHAQETDPETGEVFDAEILDSKVEDRRQQLWDELSRRQDALGDSYPFVVVKSSTGWTLTTRRSGGSNHRIARLGYVMSLLIASFRHHHIQKQDSDPAEWERLERELADRFQSLAVFAAGNMFGPGTEVYWFGFPRPEHSGFHTALPRLVEAMRLGKLLEKPPYNTESDQDATVDLVAWRRFADGHYGALVLYGQVASGNKWNDKSIYAHIQDRFFHHFIEVPASKYLGATFIPFVLHSGIKVPKDGNLTGAIRDHARAMEAGHGLLIDRIRITELMSSGVGPQIQRHNAPLACESARAALQWIRETKAYCEIAN